MIIYKRLGRSLVTGLGLVCLELLERRGFGVVCMGGRGRKGSVFLCMKVLGPTKVTCHKLKEMLKFILVYNLEGTFFLIDKLIPLQEKEKKRKK